MSLNSVKSMGGRVFSLEHLSHLFANRQHAREEVPAMVELLKFPDELHKGYPLMAPSFYPNLKKNPAAMFRSKILVNVTFNIMSTPKND